MIDKKCIIKGFQYISKEIEENKEQLTYLDQQNGDGVLGISMSVGFLAVCDFLDYTEET